MSREKFVESLQAYVNCMLENIKDNESFNMILSGLINEGITFLMHEVQVEELELISYDIAGYLESLEELSEEEFKIMFHT